ncbi:hypothetical protein GCE86_17890 [Micromonospora terminaliae]|uniref:Uncharacterized protein n=1 Tax=Micromonospora terminaliae TaxID=1914461 RepID=A0AAJ2ZFQ6_9ACTN|nr:hypothetical protein [Micromonospora terminaliae]NES29292.1 hypothetical protein [Micromonospora terminaliae]QGL48723.1 hypothetical protein GCE86_17890 [Micromonospora terminaliae]
MHWICSAATLRGDRPTKQDQYVMVDGAAAVLDGATSWLHTYHGPEPRDGGWYARTLGAALAARLPGHGTALNVILDAAIADVRDTYGLKPGESPTAPPYSPDGTPTTSTCSCSATAPRSSTRAL